MEWYEGVAADGGGAYKSVTWMKMLYLRIFIYLLSFMRDTIRFVSFRFIYLFLSALSIVHCFPSRKIRKDNAAYNMKINKFRFCWWLFTKKYTKILLNQNIICCKHNKLHVI